MGYFPQNFPTMNTTPNTFFLYSLKAYCLMEKENCIAKVQNTIFSNIQPKNFKRRHKIWFLNCYLIILRIKFSLKISTSTIKHFKKYFKEIPFLIISADIIKKSLKFFDREFSIQIITFSHNFKDIPFLQEKMFAI